MNIQKRINALRSAMAQKGIDIYIIPTADFHHSEYVGCLLYTSPSPRDTR